MMPTIALLAHDTKKEAMAAFTQKYAALLARYRLIATGITAQRIQEATGLAVEPLLPGAMGGDVQIAAEVVTGSVIAVIFLMDQSYARPHEPEIQGLLRVCELHNVMLATNLATAEVIAASLREARSAHLIFNPVSGQGNAQQALLTIRQLLTVEMHLTIHLTTSEAGAEHLAQAAIAAGADLMIVSGGDGTVSAVAGTLIGTNIPLGVIPRGTANAFAVALGIPLNTQAACQTILAGMTQIIDIARCNGLPMILLAGIGFEAETVEKASREIKDRFGPLAYILAGAQQLNEQQAFTAQIEVDGKVSEFQAAAITIANAAPPTSVLAQGFGQVIVNDGLLEVTIGAAQTRVQAIAAMLQLFGSALIRVVPNREDVICLRTRQLKVTTDPPQKVVLDGEIIGTTPVEVECIPAGLTVFAPPLLASPPATAAPAAPPESIEDNAEEWFQES
jgi:diacylglycerol kinase (ATP)